MIRQLYKNSTQAERLRATAIEREHPEFKTKACEIKCDGPSKTLARAKSVCKNTNGVDMVTFKPELTADFVYSCKTGQQPPLDENFWTRYHLSSISQLTGSSVKALSYATHIGVEGVAKSICRAVGKYPVIDVVICAVNCCQDPQNTFHYIAKHGVGGAVSTVAYIVAASLTGPLAPFIVVGGIAGGEIASGIAGVIVKKKPPKNKRQIPFSEEDDD
ncbi:unnamed protein product [Adineta steineri]|uniref:Uncharacterized protein n=1 Tax=Adineta steineri TaxID=433720 RepID=A0A815J596_9BILA|nr:unnamed protein product [Adineta steineri]CAF3766446.1 unnamed protein product [Adineta steineri]